LPRPYRVLHPREHLGAVDRLVDPPTQVVNG
jgi:hypothetical protein